MTPASIPIEPDRFGIVETTRWELPAGLDVTEPRRPAPRPTAWRWIGLVPVAMALAVAVILAVSNADTEAAVRTPVREEIVPQPVSHATTPQVAVVVPPPQDRPPPVQAPAIVAAAPIVEPPVESGPTAEVVPAEPAPKRTWTAIDVNGACKHMVAAPTEVTVLHTIERGKVKGVELVSPQGRAVEGCVMRYLRAQVEGGWSTRLRASPSGAPRESTYGIKPSGR